MGSISLVLWLTIVESGVKRLLVHNVVNMVTGGGVGVGGPGDLIGLIKLPVVPGVIPLNVWGDVGRAISYWVDSLHVSSSSLCESLGSISLVLWLTVVESGVKRLLIDNVVDVVTSGGVGVS